MRVMAVFEKSSDRIRKWLWRPSFLIIQLLKLHGQQNNRRTKYIAKTFIRKEEFVNWYPFVNVSLSYISANRLLLRRAYQQLSGRILYPSFLRGEYQNSYVLNFSFIFLCHVFLIYTFLSYFLPFSFLPDLLTLSFW